MSTQFRLGTAIAMLVLFHRIPMPIKKLKELIARKMVIVMVIIAIVKITVLLMDLGSPHFKFIGTYKFGITLGTKHHIKQTKE